MTLHNLARDGEMNVPDKQHQKALEASDFSIEGQASNYAV